MATDSLIFEIKATAKGFKVVKRDIDAVADGVERTDAARKKAGKGQDQYNKREKSLYQSGLSAGKGFSKQVQTIGSGSSGLVGAYATLAANVFAATAAFQVLKEAAQFENLVSGLEAVGHAAGRNLTFAAEKLVEVSGHALSTEKAMRSMALGISSGFSTEQMEGLTRVARGASLALGRDMGDAMDRLTRGAAKLEPEILDELGIMVRLDDATEAYATTLGKTESQLSQFERRQAFLNAILEQGELKFGQLAEEIEPNAYDKLSAALANLQKIFVSFVNEGLTPFINLLANNMGALTGMIVLFGSTIVRQMIPGLNNMAAGFANVARRGAETAKIQTQNLDVSQKLPKAYRNAVKGMDDGTISADGYNKAMKSLNDSDAAYARNIANKDAATIKGAASIAKSTAGIKGNDVARQQLIRTYNLQQIAAAKQSAANAVETASQKGMVAGFKALTVAVNQYRVAQAGATAGAGGLIAMWSALKVAGFTLAGTFAVVGASVMAALGWISILVTVGFLVYDLFKDKLFPESEVKKRADGIMESLSSVGETAKAFEKTMNTVKDPASVAVAGYKALGGVLTDFKSNLKSLTAVTEMEVEKQGIALEKLAKQTAARMQEIQNEIDEIRNNPSFFKFLDNRDVHNLKKERANLARELKQGAIETVGVIESLEQERKQKILEMTQETLKQIMSSPGFGKFSKREVEAIEKLRDEYDRGIIDEKAFTDGTEKIISPIQSINSAFAGARDAASQFAKEINKLEQKQLTPFDPAIEAAEGLMSSIKSLDEGIQGRAKTNLDSLPADLKEQYGEMLRALEQQLGKTKNIGTEDIKEYVKTLKEARQRIIDSQAELEKLGKIQARVTRLAKETASPAIYRAQLNNEQKIRNIKLQSVRDEITLQTKLRGNMTEERRNELKLTEDETERRIKLEAFDKKRIELKETINKLLRKIR